MPLPRAAILAPGSKSVNGPKAVAAILSNQGKAAVGVFDSCGQATKGAWGMSWRQEALKGVEGCEKPGVAVKQALIPGFPNRHLLNS